MMHQDDIRERHEAYVEALIEAGIEPDPTLVFATADNDENCGFLAGQAMLADGMRSTAVMVATDVNAFGLMQALTGAGLELPRDQAIVGFDDVDAATFIKPALTSIRQDFGSLGRLAAQLLLDKLAGIDVADGQHLAPTLFVVRESCGCTHDVGEASPTSNVKRTAVARRRGLEEQLDRTLTADTGAPGRSAVVAAAASSIVELLESAWKGDLTPPTQKLKVELEALYQRSPRNQTVRGVMTAARDFATELMAARAGSAGSHGGTSLEGENSTEGPRRVAAQIIRLM